MVLEQAKIARIAKEIIISAISSREAYPNIWVLETARLSTMRLKILIARSNEVETAI